MVGLFCWLLSLTNLLFTAVVALSKTSLDVPNNGRKLRAVGLVGENVVTVASVLTVEKLPGHGQS